MKINSLLFIGLAMLFSLPVFGQAVLRQDGLIPNDMAYAMNHTRLKSVDTAGKTAGMFLKYNGIGTPPSWANASGAYAIMSSHPITLTSTITWCGFYSIGYEVNSGTGGATDTSTNADNYIQFPMATTLSNLYVSLGAAQGSSNADTIIVYKSTNTINWTPTSLIVIIQNPSTTGQDNTHSVSFNAGDYVTVRVRANAGNNTKGLRIAVKATPN